MRIQRIDCRSRAQYLNSESLRNVTDSLLDVLTVIALKKVTTAVDRLKVLVRINSHHSRVRMRHVRLCEWHECIFVLLCILLDQRTCFKYGSIHEKEVWKVTTHCLQRIQMILTTKPLSELHKDYEDETGGEIWTYEDSLFDNEFDYLDKCLMRTLRVKSTTALGLTMKGEIISLASLMSLQIAQHRGPSIRASLDDHVRTLVTVTNLVGLMISNHPHNHITTQTDSHTKTQLGFDPGAFKIACVRFPIPLSRL